MDSDRFYRKHNRRLDDDFYLKSISILVVAVILFYVTSCTLNITMTDTHGVSDDVVDTTTKEDLEGELSVPIKGI